MVERAPHVHVHLSLFRLPSPIKVYKNKKKSAVQSVTTFREGSDIAFTVASQLLLKYGFNSTELFNT